MIGNSWGCGGVALMKRKGGGTDPLDAEELTSKVVALRIYQQPMAR